jgi:hypothetical protein
MGLHRIAAVLLRLLSIQFYLQAFLYLFAFPGSLFRVGNYNWTAAYAITIELVMLTAKLILHIILAIVCWKFALPLGKVLTRGLEEKAEVTAGNAIP